MHRVISLRREHSRINENMILMEELIEDVLDGKNTKIKDIQDLLNETLEILPDHKETEASLLKDLSKMEPLRNQIKNVILEHQVIRGHLRVLEDAFVDGDSQKICLALDNDCRMLMSKVREHIYKEERIFDQALFLHFMRDRPAKFV